MGVYGVFESTPEDIAPVVQPVVQPAVQPVEVCRLARTNSVQSVYSLVQGDNEKVSSMNICLITFLSITHLSYYLSKHHTSVLLPF